jgi:hypothetical protein
MGFDDGVKNQQELAYGRDQGDFVQLAPGA